MIFISFKFVIELPFILEFFEMSVNSKHQKNKFIFTPKQVYLPGLAFTVKRVYNLGIKFFVSINVKYVTLMIGLLV